MGFERISNQADGFLLNGMKPGECKDVYIKDVVPDINRQFSSQTVNFVGYDPETGRDIKILTGGTAKYDATNIAAAKGMKYVNGQDIKVSQDQLEDGKEKMKLLGYLCRFTRVGSYTQKKGGKIVATFNIERDPEKTLDAFLASKG